jgi:hypothetical protein
MKVSKIFECQVGSLILHDFIYKYITSLWLFWDSFVPCNSYQYIELEWIPLWLLVAHIAHHRIQNLFYVDFRIVCGLTKHGNRQQASSIDWNHGWGGMGPHMLSLGNNQYEADCFLTSLISSS